MAGATASRKHKPVYVIGAGFSAGLGYPVTAGLLEKIWLRLDSPLRRDLRKVIKFHHPDFDPAKRASFPNIEQLLTEINVNLTLFDASRENQGSFEKSDLEEVRDGLLSTVATWFHELYGGAAASPWLPRFSQRLREEHATVISFNWDLVLEQQLFEGAPTAKDYGLTKVRGKGPRLLKPHGSLNWYESTHVETVSVEKREEIFPAAKSSCAVESFIHPRGIVSKAGKRYTPLIIPPTYLKDFRKPVFRKLWRESTHALSTASEIVLVGYSLPNEDLHAKFILRCGFHNQVEGCVGPDGVRTQPTGIANVLVVNPDSGARDRIRETAGRSTPFKWKNLKVEQWVETW